MSTGDPNPGGCKIWVDAPHCGDLDGDMPLSRLEEARRKSVLKPYGEISIKEEKHMQAQIDVLIYISRHGETWINNGEAIVCPECGAPRNRLVGSIDTSEFTKTSLTYNLGLTCNDCQCKFNIVRTAQKEEINQEEKERSQFVDSISTNHPAHNSAHSDPQNPPEHIPYIYNYVKYLK